MWGSRWQWERGSCLFDFFFLPLCPVFAGPWMHREEELFISLFCFFVPSAAVCGVFSHRVDYWSVSLIRAYQINGWEKQQTFRPSAINGQVLLLLLSVYWNKLTASLNRCKPTAHATARMYPISPLKRFFWGGGGGVPYPLWGSKYRGMPCAVKTSKTNCDLWYLGFINKI